MTQAGRLEQSGLGFLRRSQQTDGGFTGLASNKAADFSRATKRPTVFFTALILSCLHNLKDSHDISAKAAAFLLRQRSDDWSWNYWQRDSPEAKEEPYPDDLDDTACALAALSRFKPQTIDGGVLGHIARQLVSAETEPGGPYQTWLINVSEYPNWNDIDIAVNANIGFFLAEQGVELAALQAYIARAISRQSLDSSYYVGTIPTLYFLSRWYRGVGLRRLQSQVRELLQEDSTAQNPLHLALLISAGQRLGVVQGVLKAARANLLKLRRGDHWSAVAFYYEPALAGKQRYAGSAALTTAFALEALQSTGPAIIPQRRQATTQSILRLAASELRAVGAPELMAVFSKYSTVIRDMEQPSQHITGMAQTAAAARGQAVESLTARHLNLGSLYGWMAYSIYDDFLDDEGDPASLNLANWSQRQSIRHFQAALPDNAAFDGTVSAAFDRIDSANAWELAHTRPALHGQTLFIERLPFYGRHKQLAARSWGHHLAASGVLAALGSPIGNADQQALDRFFEHFLIARQLHDDAHDWETDLQHGQLSAVVSLLLRERRRQTVKINVPRELPALRLQFWEHTIITVSSLIRRHIAVARQALQDCQVLAEPQQFGVWLDELETGVSQALEGRLEAQKFIGVYARVGSP